MTLAESQPNLPGLRVVLNRLKEVPPLIEGAILVTMDVSALYTNIPHSEGVLACNKMMASNDVTQHDEISQLIKFILEHNNFTFNGRHYLQTKGTAMGTRMAPSYANIFMYYLEQELLSSSSYKPCLYVRYIDDIFMLWDKGEQELDNFFTFANDFHDSIKFTTERSTKQIPFLDVLVMIDDHKIETSVYAKPTDRHERSKYFVTYLTF